jgi:hypothetical protein
MLGVDRHGSAAAPDCADDLAGVAGAFAHGRNPSIGYFAEVVAVAVSAAGADRQRAGGVRGAERRDQNKCRSESARAAVPITRVMNPLPRERPETSE